MSIQPVTLVERLELLVCMTSLALSCGLLVLICAQKGKSGWAWAWTLGRWDLGPSFMLLFRPVLPTRR